MRYEVFGGNLPAVTVYLEPGESIYTQSGGMSWMSDGIRMETNMKGGLMKGLARMVTGESLFMATYTATQPNDEITVASSFPGSILTLEVGPGREYIAQKSAFLCAQPQVEIRAETVRGLSAGLFGGDGFLLQRYTGRGLIWLEIDGSVKEVQLPPGKRLIVDTGNVAAYDATCGYSVETVKGFKNILFGGEGLFLTTVTGPGRVWLQTMTMPSFAGKIAPFLQKRD